MKSAVVLEGLSLVPSISVHQLTTTSSASSRGSTALFCTLWVLQACAAHIYMQAITCMHKIKINKTFFNIKYYSI